LIEEIILYYDARSKKHQNPRHVSSNTLLIFRRSNCVVTASGIVTQPFSAPVVLSRFVEVHYMTFAQRRNRLTTRFSERIPVVERRISVYRS